MWLTTTTGFYSATLDCTGKDIQIRARVEADLDALKQKYAPELGDIIHTPKADYPYRLICTHQQWADIVSKAALDITYANFKNEVKKQQGEARANAYLNVWQDMLQLEKFNKPGHVIQDDPFERFNMNEPQREVVQIRYVMTGDLTDDGIVTGVRAKKGKTILTFSTGKTKKFNNFDLIDVIF
jgi:hypothetical protein